MITAPLGLPTSWSAFASRINSLKDTPTFEQLWNACCQKEVKILLVSNKENEEENISNAYFNHHKNKGIFKKFKVPRKIIDLSKIGCYNCHKMGHHRSNCPENPRNKRRDKDQANSADEGSSKKNKMK